MTSVQYPGGLLSTRRHVVIMGLLMAVGVAIPVLSRSMAEGATTVAAIAIWLVVPVGWSIRMLITLGRLERAMQSNQHPPVPNEAMVLMFRTAMMLPVIGYGPLLMAALWRH